MKNNNPPIYLDYNATAPIKPSAIAAMNEVMGIAYNASSIHNYGRKAKMILENARETILRSLGAEGATLAFTASGTEANNLALQALKVKQLAVSAVEHVSVLAPAYERNAFVIPVDENGVVKIDALDAFLATAEAPVLVSIMAANNETGVIQPITEIAKITLAHKAYLHVDASQYYGKLPLDFHALNTDLMTVSGHKMGAPLGSAALVIKRGLHVNSQLKGGGHESGYRAGTENLPAIAGFAAAAKELSFNDAVAELRDYFEAEILAFAPDTIIYGKSVNRLPNTSCLRMKNVENHVQLIHFDLAGVMVSAGSACSSGKVGVSHVLAALGVSAHDAKQAIRVSLGAATTKVEIDTAIDLWKKLYSLNHSKALAA